MKLEIGQSYLKGDIHNAYGGNPRAGICPTAAGQVLIFSDPPSGSRFGYDHHDEVVADIYRFTGEGQTGDQQLVRGNKALLSNSKLLLFARQDAKSWIFVGEVSLDVEPFEIANAPDLNGNPRKVFVFRFIEKDADFALLSRN